MRGSHFVRIWQRLTHFIRMWQRLMHFVRIWHEFRLKNARATDLARKNGVPGRERAHNAWSSKRGLKKAAAKTVACVERARKNCQTRRLCRSSCQSRRLRKGGLGENCHNRHLCVLGCQNRPSRGTGFRNVCSLAIVKRHRSRSAKQMLTLAGCPGCSPGRSAPASSGCPASRRCA